MQKSSIIDQNPLLGDHSIESLLDEKDSIKISLKSNKDNDTIVKSLHAWRRQVNTRLKELGHTLRNGKNITSKKTQNAAKKTKAGAQRKRKSLRGSTIEEKQVA